MARKTYTVSDPAALARQLSEAGSEMSNEALIALSIAVQLQKLVAALTPRPKEPPPVDSN